MAEKDVKSAKKLYAKMKKAQKAQNNQESAPASASDANGDDKAEDSAAHNEEQPPQTSEATDVQGLSEPAVTQDEVSGDVVESKEDTPANDEALQTTVSEDQKPDTQAEDNDVPEEPPSQEATVESESIAANAVQASEDLGSAKKEKAVPSSKIESAHQVVPAKATVSASAAAEVEETSDNRTTGDDAEILPETKELGSTDVSPPASKTELNKSSGSQPATESPETVADASAASTIAELREENDDLRSQIKKLEGKVVSLESELTAVRQHHAEVSLSPSSLPHDDDRLSREHRTRTSSFVEADLYSESEKVNSRREQMKKWQGYQIDLRGWRRPLGIGEPVKI